MPRSTTRHRANPRDAPLVTQQPRGLVVAVVIGRERHEELIRREVRDDTGEVVGQLRLAQAHCAVGVVEEPDDRRAHALGGILGFAASTRDVFLALVSAGAGCAVRDEHDPDLAAGLHVADDGATRADDLVVGVRRDDQHTPRGDVDEAHRYAVEHPLRAAEEARRADSTDDADRAVEHPAGARLHRAQCTHVKLPRKVGDVPSPVRAANGTARGERAMTSS